MSIISYYNEEEKGKVLENLTCNVKQIQDDLLKEIVTLNSGTEYLQNFLHGSSAKELFKKNVPIVTYKDVKPYIDRVANGESSNIISALPITNLFNSSGTSGGANKILPSNSKFLDGNAFINDLIAHVISKHMKGVERGKGMHFFLTGHEIKSPGGLPIEDAISCDLKQNLYCHLLCGLVQRDEVTRFGSTFASGIVRVIKVLEDSWKELCSDIRSGHLSEWITDSGCRNSVSMVLGGQPRPKLSDEIENICSQKSWKGIMKKLWPQTMYVEAVVTGSMVQYVPTLEHYCDDLPLVSIGYASSESMFGINTDPLCKPEDTSYTLLPNLSYFEFIPTEGGNGDVVDLADVKLGCSYQLLITNLWGLYRMRIGDIVKVTGFHNKAPKLKVIGRENTLLSIDTDRTTEEYLLKAVNRARLVLESSDLKLVNFTSYADISSSPGHYVIYWEVKAKEEDMKDLDEKTLLECCLVMEDTFDEEYMYCRSNEFLGPLEIRVVNDGTFDSLMNLSISKGASITQYKTPTCIISEEGLQVLETNVVARFFSTLKASHVLKP
ncbi:Auxin-responsive GH3 family protein [Raphanus sativus]|nr:Auxin-responsive GH3 family protein [Raphanus sativus]